MSDLDWNKEFALEQAADDAELLNELLEIFRDSSQNDLTLIKEGMENKDADQVAAAAHSIKGAAASLGINGITKVTKTIEEDSRKGGLTAVEGLYPDLVTLLE